MNQVLEELWDPSHHRQTRYNAKCCTKRLCKYLGLTTKCTRDEFEKGWADKELAYQKVREGPDPANSLKVAAQLFTYFGRTHVSDFLSQKIREDFTKTTESKPFTKKNRQKPPK